MTATTVIGNCAQTIENGTYQILENDICVYVANFAAYNSGKAAGQWLQLPCDTQDIQETLVNIGCRSNNGEYLHDYALFDYHDLTGLHLGDICGQYASIAKINEFAELWYDDNLDRDKLVEIANTKILNILDLIELAENLDEYIYIPVSNQTELGEYFVNELGTFHDYPEEVLQYFDYEAYGRDMKINYGMTQTKNGYYYFIP